MLEAKSKGDNEFVVWGTGSPIREWAYIDDFVEVLVRCLKIEGMEFPVNMGQGNGYSIKESAELIRKACNFEGKIVFDTNYKDGDPVKIVDGNKFDKTFENFEFYNHFEGILNTVKYYEDLR